jgi:hypothetical protein
MPFSFRNLLGSVKNFFGDTVPKGIKTLGSKIGSGLQNAGGALGGFVNKLGSVYGKAKNIPILGSLLQPLEPYVQKGLDIGRSGSNLLGQLGRGDIEGAVGTGRNIASSILGGGIGTRIGASIGSLD